MTPKEQFEYKIRIKSTGKYYSRNRKSSWRQKGALASVLQDLLSSGRYKTVDLEIAIFPLSNPTTISTSEFLRDLQMAAQLEKEKALKIKRDKEELHAKILSYFKGFNLKVEDIKQLVQDKGRLHPVIQSELEDLFYALNRVSRSV